MSRAPGAGSALMNDNVKRAADGELGILARRKIEAAIIAPIYDEMRQAVGEEKARDILRRAIRRAAIDAGAEMASRADGTADLEGFKAILPLWTKDDALTTRSSTTGLASSTSKSSVAATRKLIEPWGSATSETSYRATAMARSARATTRASS